ncbi:MAG: AAA family ATPase [Candidatus Manganitrophus sp.]|nr:AAA family ATPase [Candidatus Manganitrophus sp.]
MDNKSVQILVIGNDAGLKEEFKAALEGVNDRRLLVFSAPGFAQAEEIVRSRQPQLVCAELNRATLPDLKTFARETLRSSPATILAAMCRSNPAEVDSDNLLLIEAVRAGVKDFLRHPLSSTELRQLIDRLFMAPPPVRNTDGKIISFIGNKGGVGKSTLAVNAACALALRHPDEVLLIDASLQLGVCAIMLDLHPRTTLVDAVRERGRLDETLLRQLATVHASRLHLLAAPADAMEAAEVDEESIYRFLNLARRAFKFVLVDTFPLLDGTAMAVLDLSDTAYLVLQGMAPSVIGMSKLLPALQGLGLSEDRQRLVLNQNYRPFSGSLKPSDIEQRLSRPLDYIFPYEKKLLLSANLGEPLILHAGWLSRFGREMTELVDEIAAPTQPEEIPQDAGEPDGRLTLPAQKEAQG